MIRSAATFSKQLRGLEKLTARTQIDGAAQLRLLLSQQQRADKIRQARPTCVLRVRHLETVDPQGV